MGQTLELERLTARVRHAARSGDLIETAQVKLLGLDEVRAAAGSRWVRMREHVREGSVRIIAARIGPDDAVVPCGDGFLVVFAHASPEVTQERCAEIRDALVAYYLGEEALARLRADVQREAASAANLAGLVCEPPSEPMVSPPHNEFKPGKFWPVWSFRRQVTAAYLCAPDLDIAPAGSAPGYGGEFLGSARRDDCDVLDLDLCLLEQACATAEQSGAAVIGVSVHATTLQSRKRRDAYLAQLAANAAGAHQRMFVTVCEILPGTPLISLGEWCSALRRSFSRVALELHHSDRALSGLASTGAWAAGYRLPIERIGDQVQLQSALNSLDLWCRTLVRQGVQPFIHGFASSGFLDLASYSDISFATGGRIWPARHTLECSPALCAS